MLRLHSPAASNGEKLPSVSVDLKTQRQRIVSGGLNRHRRCANTLVGKTHAHKNRRTRWLSKNSTPPTINTRPLTDGAAQIQLTWPGNIHARKRAHATGCCTLTDTDRKGGRLRNLIVSKQCTRWEKRSRLWLPCMWEANTPSTYEARARSRTWLLLHHEIFTNQLRAANNKKNLFFFSTSLTFILQRGAPQL